MERRGLCVWLGCVSRDVRKQGLKTHVPVGLRLRSSWWLLEHRCSWVLGDSGGTCPRGVSFVYTGWWSVASALDRVQVPPGRVRCCAQRASHGRDWDRKLAPVPRCLNENL